MPATDWAGPNAIGQAFTQGQTIADVEAWPERIAAVTPEQVMKAARPSLMKEFRDKRIVAGGLK